MKLPGADRALIDSAKVRDYLLSPTHPVGRFKAAFFGGLGYSRNRWERLDADIRKHAVEQDAIPTRLSEYGQKYEIRCRLSGPSGGQAEVVSVWIVLTGEDFPRLVTAFPGSET